MKAITLLYHDVVKNNDYQSSGFQSSDADYYKLDENEFIAPIDDTMVLPSPLNFNYQLLRKYNDEKTGNKKIVKYILEHSSKTKQNL